MATTQLPSILTSLEIPFVTCVSVPVIRHGSMKSLCLSVSWLGFWGATRATRELVEMMHGKKRVEKCFVYLKSGTVSLATVGLLPWKSLLSPLTFFISNRPQALIRVCFPFFFCFPSHIQYSFFLFVCFFEAIPENRWMWAPMAQTSIIMSTRISSTRTVTALAKRRLLVALGGWPRRSRIWRRTSHRGVITNPGSDFPPEFPPFLIGEKIV